MKVALLGFDVEGTASFEYFKGRGDELTICDQNTNVAIPGGVASQLGEHYLDDLDRFDLLVRTPGLHPQKILERNPSVADKITTSTNEFMRACPTKNVIGVTGTKGKGTTSTLIAKMLEAAGKRVHLGGNIGVAPLKMLEGTILPEDWVVLELSNFQLIDLKYSPHIAVCLMVVPEHLNWHTSMQEYLSAKQQLCRWQSAGDTAIYFSENDYSKQIATTGKAQVIPFFTPPGAFVESGSVVIEGRIVCHVSELKLLGEHNWQNICAAVTAVWQITQDAEAIHSVLASFSGLPHRLELVRVVDDVHYYNDSFAATPDAAIAALAAIKEPKVAILGGFDRNLPLGHLAQAVKDHQDDIRKVVIIGASGKRLASELDAAGFTNYHLEESKQMPEIVAAVKGFARSGDAVILTPGFASFDMFKNFEDRGLQFKAAVEKL